MKATDPTPCKEDALKRIMAWITALLTLAFADPSDPDPRRRGGNDRYLRSVHALRLSFRTSSALQPSKARRRNEAV